MCLIANNASTFQTIRSRITIIMKTKQMFYVIRNHYMAHKFNLIVQSFSIMPMVFKLEDILQELYGYFSTSPK
jgi:hypothetical protein